MRLDAVFANGHYYHIFNRGVARMPTFSQARDYERLMLDSKYYRFGHPPLKLSKFRKLSLQNRQEIMKTMAQKADRLVSIQCFTFMPNHFHFLLRQNLDRGISRFLSQITNSYTKYFNTKYDRVGPLFQGPFRAVRIESEAQLVHVSRYIHLNPLIDLVVPTVEALFDYPWSSFRDYLKGGSDWLELEPVLPHFQSPNEYRRFVIDQIDYSKELKLIKHLLIG